jgi:hypothetical protein
MQLHQTPKMKSAIFSGAEFGAKKTTPVPKMVPNVSPGHTIAVKN